jgi:hypothetical protein
MGASRRMAASRQQIESNPGPGRIAVMYAYADRPSQVSATANISRTSILHRRRRASFILYRLRTREFV